MWSRLFSVSFPQEKREKTKNEIKRNLYMDAVWLSEIWKYEDRILSKVFPREFVDRK